MKSVGVIGTGHRTTLLALEHLNSMYQKLTSEQHTCPIHLIQPDFYEINELLPLGINEAAEHLRSFIKAFPTESTSNIILLNNTLHEALDIVVEDLELNINVLHIGHLLRLHFNQVPVSKVAILGTKHTMSSSYFKSFIPPSVAHVEIPLHLAHLVEELRKTYFFGNDITMAEQCFMKLMNEFDQDTTFVLACTELSIAFKDVQLEMNHLDTLKLLCERAVNELITHL